VVCYACHSTVVGGDLFSPEAIVAELRRRGHRVVHTGTNGGGYQAILIDQATGVLHGASEPRKDGCAAGY